MILSLSYLLVPILFIPFAILFYVLNNFLLTILDLSSFQLFLLNTLLLIFPLGVWFTSLAIETKLINNLKLNKRFISFSPFILCFILSSLFFDANFVKFLDGLLISVEILQASSTSVFLVSFLVKLSKIISSILIIFYFLQFVFEFIFVIKASNKPFKYNDFKIFISIFIVSMLADFLVSKFILF